MRDCCTFMILMLSIPPLRRVKDDIDMEVNIDFCKGNQSNGARPVMIVHMKCAL